MNRRTFTATSLAAFLAPAGGGLRAQQTGPALPGYQIAEIKNGLLRSGYGGMATAQTAVNDDTLFQVASCSKTVNALAVMTLARDGKIDLDRPANQYLRRWQIPGPRGADATVADLMSHSAGTTVDGFVGYAPDGPLPGLLDILNGSGAANSAAIQTRRRLFGNYRYSGGGTTVLQALIEDVTQTDFAAYTTAQVLTPIGAPNATFAVRPSASIAHGSFSNGEPLPGGFRRHPESAAAGLWATASDLAKVLQAIVQSLNAAPDKLLPPVLAYRMTTLANGVSALGVFVHPGAIISHSGRNYGFDSVMAAELETGTVRAIVANRNGAIDGFIEQVTTG